MEMLRYTAIASLCLSFFYLAYRLVFKKEENFYQMRIFLLFSLAISVLLPSYTGRIEIPLLNKDHQAVYQYVLPASEDIAIAVPQQEKSVDWSAILIKVYTIVAGALILRIIVQLLVLS